MDSASVSYRLLARETVLPVSEPSITRCTKRFLAFQSDSAEDSASSLNEFLKELALYEFEANKAKVIHKTCEQEIEEYAKLSKSIASEISETSSEIEELREKLRKERILRMQREESESLAKVVNELPSREVTKRNLESVKRELENLDAIHSRSSETLSLRQKQFQLLMQSLYELQRAVAEPSQEETSSVNDMEIEN